MASSSDANEPQAQSSSFEVSDPQAQESLELGSAREVQLGERRKCGICSPVGLVSLLVIGGLLFVMAGGPSFFFDAGDVPHGWTPSPVVGPPTTSSTTSTTTTTTSSTTTTTTPPDCSKKPASLQSSSDVGCAGAKTKQGAFDEALCTNSGHQQNDILKWYASCCVWAHNECVPQEPCEAPRGIANARESGGACAEGATIRTQGFCTAKCKFTYAPFPASLQCKHGVLDPPEFKCEASCSAPKGISKVASGGACKEGNMIASGDTCTSQCAPDHHPSTSSLKCKASKLTPSTFKCEAECTSPTGISHTPSGKASCAEGAKIKDGSPCTPQCAAGYEASQKTLTCTDGKLSPSSFDCKPLPPPPPTGACTVEDLSQLGKLKQDTSSGSFGDKCSVCGHSAFSIFSGFDKKAFSACLQKSAKLSQPCSECYAVAGAFGAGSCKMACLTGWCTKGCLYCTRKSTVTTAHCSGFYPPGIVPCD